MSREWPKYTSVRWLSPETAEEDRISLITGEEEDPESGTAFQMVGAV